MAHDSVESNISLPLVLNCIEANALDSALAGPSFLLIVSVLSLCSETHVGTNAVLPVSVPVIHLDSRLRLHNEPMQVDRVLLTLWSSPCPSRVDRPRRWECRPFEL